MAKKQKKAASELTTDEVLERLFGKGAAKKLRQAVEELDAKKTRGKRAENDDDEDDD
jgi:hypothetical protein